MMKTVNKLIIAGLLLASFVSADTIPTISPFKQTATSIVPINKSLELVIGRGLTLGNSTSTLSGTIRWTGLAWEGYTGSSWTSLGGGGSGLTSLNGQTGSTQTFSTSSLVTGLNINLSSAADNHNISLATSSGYSLILLTDISKLNALDNASTSWVNYTYASTSYLLKGTVSDTKYCVWDNANGKVNCNAEGGTGFTTTSINGLATTTFAFTTSSDTNIGIIIATSTNGVSFTPTWIGTLADARIASADKWNALDSASTTWSTYAYNSSTFPTFNYVSTSFATSGQVITAHSALTNLDYASAGHTGFEPTVTKGNLTNGNNITIGGSGTGAVIGTGASVALNDTISLTGVSSTYATHTLSKITNASTTNLTNSGNAYLGVTRFTGITGLTQCLNVDENGVVSGTGAACGSGSGGINSLAGQTGASQTISTGTKPTGLDFKVVSGSNDHQFILTIDSGLFIPSSSPAFASITTTNLWAGGLKYPTADGTNLQCLKTNGSGILSFGDCSTAGGSFTTTTFISNISFATTSLTFATGSAPGLNLNITGNSSAGSLTFTPQLQAGYFIPTTSPAFASVTTTNLWTTNLWSTGSTTLATTTIASSTIRNLNFVNAWGGNISTTNFTNSGNSYLGTVLSGVWNGSDIDISDYTNLSAGSGVVLTDDALSHSTANGYLHIPSNGATAQMLQYQGTAGTAKWVALSGDATIADGGAITVADDSHAHTGSTISGSLTLTGVSSTYATATWALIANASTTNLTVSGNSYLGTVKSGTWNGSAIDISSYTNLTANNGLQLNGDNIEPAANYSMFLTASGTAWNNATLIVSNSSTKWDTAYTKSHDAVTESITGLALTGQALSLDAGYFIPTTSPAFASVTTTNLYPTNIIGATNVSTTNLTIGTNLYWGSGTGLMEVISGVARVTSTANFLTTGNASATYVPFSYASTVFATYAYESSTRPTFAYVSSSFPTFAYVSSSFATSTHYHTTSSITSGVFGTAFLGTGSANAGTYLAGDGTWKATSTLNIFSSPLTTKGDILAFSTVNTRLPVGGDGQKLTASSTATAGLAWASSTVVIPVSPSGFFNSDSDIFGNTPYSYSIYQMTCKLRGAVTSTLPTVTMTIANAAGSTVGTLLCNTSTAFYTTTTITNGNISANSNLQWTASNASGTFNGVLISVHATK